MKLDLTNIKKDGNIQMPSFSDIKPLNTPFNAVYDKEKAFFLTYTNYILAHVTKLVAPYNVPLADEFTRRIQNVVQKLADTPTQGDNKEIEEIAEYINTYIQYVEHIHGADVIKILEQIKSELDRKPTSIGPESGSPSQSSNE